jgi:hypothetical protein
VSQPTRAIRTSLIFIHRWIGVALSIPFAMWFASGIVLMYWDYPSVGAENRIERAPALNPAAIRLSPRDAYARLQTGEPAAQVRLNTFDGRPVYRFTSERGERLVYADTGEEQVLASPEMTLRIASAWTSQPAARARKDLLEEPDQWTVQENLRDLMPLRKYSWPNGEQVYVSDATGEVVQYTTRSTRFWSYLGAIPHWLYFTPLRKHGPAWSRLVIWTSGIGAATAIFGIAIGVWMYSPAKRYRRAGRPSSFPYRGQKRWHAILGLVFGVTALTWAFSGMMSMDPFPNAARETSSVDLAAALHGALSFDAFQPRELLERSGLKAKEIEFTALAGEPYSIATLEPHNVRAVPIHGEPASGFDPNRIIAAIQRAVPRGTLAETRLVDEYDAYYLDRHHELPLPVVLVALNDAGHTRYYIDPKTARFAGRYSSRGWAERWLYHGLHSLDFPWLYKHRPIWDIIVISCMLGGTTLSVTSLILAWRVLVRKLARLAAA